MSAVAEVMVQRGEERRKVLWAVLASILVHLLVAYSLAAFGTRASTPVVEEEKPLELTMVDLAPAPTVPKNPPFVETEKSKESVEKPKEQTFESNANSIAASNATTATGDQPLPAQEGKDRPVTTLASQLSLPSEGAQPQPQQQQQATPQQRQPTPEAVATPLPDQFAMLTSTPTPPPPKAPEEAEAAFVAQTQ